MIEWISIILYEVNLCHSLCLSVTFYLKSGGIVFYTETLIKRRDSNNIFTLNKFSSQCKYLFL